MVLWCTPPLISLPYRGCAFIKLRPNVIVTTAKTLPGGLGKLLDRYRPRGVSEKPGGSGQGLDSYRSQWRHLKDAIKKPAGGNRQVVNAVIA